MTIPGHLRETASLHNVATRLPLGRPLPPHSRPSGIHSYREIHQISGLSAATVSWLAGSVSYAERDEEGMARGEGVRGIMFAVLVVGEISGSM